MCLFLHTLFLFVLSAFRFVSVSLFPYVYWNLFFFAVLNMHGSHTIVELPDKHLMLGLSSSSSSPSSSQFQSSLSSKFTHSDAKSNINAHPYLSNPCTTTQNQKRRSNSPLFALSPIPITITMKALQFIQIPLKIS